MTVVTLFIVVLGWVKKQTFGAEPMVVHVGIKSSCQSWHLNLFKTLKALYNAV